MSQYMQRGGIFAAAGVPVEVETGLSDRVPQSIRQRTVNAIYQQRVAMQGFGSVGPADPMRPMRIGGGGPQLGARHAGIFDVNFMEPSGRSF